MSDSVISVEFQCAGQTFTLTRQLLHGVCLLHLFREDRHGWGSGTSRKSKEPGLDLLQTKLRIREEIQAAAKIMADAKLVDGEFEEETVNQFRGHLLTASALMKTRRFPLKSLVPGQIVV